MLRRQLLGAALGAWAGPAVAESSGARLARAARAQLGVTRGYDPAYVRLDYPGGDVPRATGVCADVVIRAARDGLGLDLQTLVHDDMRRAFAAYPSKRVWGLSATDSNIDHRRVLNLETYWRRRGAQLWRAPARTPGHAFPPGLAPGDILTWQILGSGPHVGVVSETGRLTQVVHNIGWGAQQVPLLTFLPHRAVAWHRWPRGA